MSSVLVHTLLICKLWNACFGVLLTPS
jgi:hypothetical protein